MAYKSKLYRYIIKFLAIPILLMPSSIILGSMGDQNKQNIPKSSELAKKYYIQQQSLESKKNKDKISLHKNQKKNRSLPNNVVV